LSGFRAIASATIAITHPRVWLRDEVVKGVPFWLDHLLLMVTLMVVVWGLIELLTLGPRGVALGRPDRPKEAWLAGLVSGLGLSALVLAVLAVLGTVVMEPHPNWPVLFANFVNVPSHSGSPPGGLGRRRHCHPELARPRASRHDAALCRGERGDQAASTRTDAR
jgi:hypothetical protein